MLWLEGGLNCKLLGESELQSSANGQSLIFGEQLTQEIKCPHGKKTTPTWLDMHILQIRSSLQTNGVQHWIHFIIIMSNIWINFIKNMFKNEMDPVFWVLFFSEALGPIPNWILFRFPDLIAI